MTLERSAYHLGIAVPNVDEAVQSYGKRLGIAFTEPQTFVLPQVSGPRIPPQPLELRVAFSRTEAPFIELLHGNLPAVYSDPPHGQIHHLGYWEPDLPSRIESLRAQGIEVEAYLVAQAGSPPTAIYTVPDVFGVRREYVSEAFRPFVEEWVRLGRMPDLG